MWNLDAIILAIFCPELVEIRLFLNRTNCFEKWAKIKKIMEGSQNAQGICQNLCESFFFLSRNQFFICYSSLPSIFVTASFCMFTNLFQFSWLLSFSYMAILLISSWYFTWCIFSFNLLTFIFYFIFVYIFNFLGRFIFAMTILWSALVIISLIIFDKTNIDDHFFLYVFYSIKGHANGMTKK